MNQSKYEAERELRDAGWGMKGCRWFLKHPKYGWKGTARYVEQCDGLSFREACSIACISYM